MLCPKCNSDAAQRSHRKGLRDRLGSLLGWAPYRCQCGHRFLERRHARPESTARVTSVEAEIRATRARVQRKKKRREMLVFGGALLLFVALLYYLTRERGSYADGS